MKELTNNILAQIEADILEIVYQYVIIASNDDDAF